MHQLKDWRKKVDSKTTQTLKFMNLARILRIIQYDPAQYMNSQKMNTLAKGERPEGEPYYSAKQDEAVKNYQNDPRRGLVEATRKNNIGLNLF